MFRIAGGVLLLAITTGYAAADVPKRQVDQAAGSWRQSATASHYGGYFHGRRAADGSVFDQMASTAAMKKPIPLGTIVRVTNPSNNRSEVVKITDRGPFIAGRDIDLSLGTARRLGLEQQGVGKVELEILR